MANNRSNQFSAEKYKRLQAEAKAPYRGLRKTIYVVFAASGLIGAFVMLSQLAAGENIARILPNFGLQVAVVALMVWLFRIDDNGKKSE
ncbi:DUF3493 domain-containing protein [Euhalothece natronophila Z-M001]|uniref:DUF3493 domain-containing protein n=1 Tax=Euhalothece natronophila Z-M001 TaxID=522448 RepID=A0A5B8NQK7_9CHRO|nr:DUF3493 domain-containing protein [Euhalothece natronophila]QDZ40480.1 DUF3493 domain-containing protein [Euhalothece natronophila Z-M001]